MSIVTRFAPSPTGYLHLGHAASALFAWRQARAAGGRFLLRLEDIDPTRCRPEYAAAVLEDLAWLGLDWDGPVRVQSEHLAEYRAVLDALGERGLVYPCFCTRAAIQREVAEAASTPHAPDGSLRYPGTCRGLSAAERRRRIAAGEPHVLRLDIAAALRAVGGPLSFIDMGPGCIEDQRCIEGQGAVANQRVIADQGRSADQRRITCAPEQFGDVVLARRDAPASYHLCVTHDDALQGVTLVTRGIDLLPATHLHRLLQALMGWPEPAYAHHRLLTDASGRRLAKRDRAATLRALRAEGRTPEAVRGLAQFQ